MRIWMDPSYMSQISKRRIQELVKIGNVLVTDEGIVDMNVFQESPAWTKQLLKTGKLVIEAKGTLNELTSTNLFWYSCGITTSACITFEDAIFDLPNANGILEVAVLVEEFKANWIPGSIVPPPLSIEDTEILWVDHKASRTEIYEAAKKRNKFHVYEYHNKIFVHSLAKMHHCDAYLTKNGSVEEVVK